MDIEKNIPKLRFSGFRGKWEEWKLRDVTSIKSGATPLRSNKLFFDGGDIPWVKTTDLNNSFIFRTEEKITAFARARINPVDSVLVAMYGGFNQIGRTGYLKVPAATNQALSVLNANVDKVQPLYLLIWLNAKVELWKEFAGSSRKDPNITGSDVAAFPISLPSLPEQRKIASFLIKVDEKLSQLKKKKELLEKYKKGIMQKIFSQEIRFKDDNGKEFPEWGEKFLREISEKRTEKNREGRIKDVLTNSAAYGIVNQRDYFDKDIANQNNLLGYYIVEHDDFVYNPRISNLAPVGPIGRNHLKTGVMSPLYSVFRIKDGCTDFYELYFTTNFWHEYMESIANYGARFDRMNVTTKDFYDMPLPYPCHQEQIKIANFLSTIDKKIDHIQTKIDKAEQWKNGLFQQMFV